MDKTMSLTRQWKDANFQHLTVLSVLQTHFGQLKERTTPLQKTFNQVLDILVGTGKVVMFETQP